MEILLLIYSLLELFLFLFKLLGRNRIEFQLPASHDIDLIYKLILC